jgi:hypothetical protein
MATAYLGCDAPKPQGLDGSVGLLILSRVLYLPANNLTRLTRESLILKFM